MYNVHRKNFLAKNLNSMKASFSNEFDFFPQTWLLPKNRNDLCSQFQGTSYSQELLVLLTGKHYPSEQEIRDALGEDKGLLARQGKVFIAKPVASCQGKGIFLITKEKDIPSNVPCVVQEYLNK